eukprot:CAMPEP_0197675252 /NCGR_PEP_ID=MMETSP1338-20131121/84587_1 /TAXON_ID=43686 ORGANISM="Pelagodinium beii, Strain RCC1491" /NCGR_SAMPLE_ID=MMETSP1338 /ASSEMBLY_ACC=CAM_ASM_000754 /LENGTH=74 /DNA_ID=CAMNT_0043255783 /DNA_START=56 /DNA_END=280 /DNA_ORIENTATION=+
MSTSDAALTTLTVPPISAESMSSSANWIWDGRFTGTARSSRGVATPDVMKPSSLPVSTNKYSAPAGNGVSIASV